MAVLLLLLFSRICIRITVRDGKPSAVFSYLFLFKKTIYPSSKQRKTDKKGRKNKAEASDNPKPSKKGKGGGLRALAELRSLLEAILQRMPRTLTLRVRRLTIRVGSDDPAKTALLYGSASTAFSFFLEWLDHKLLTVCPERGSELGVKADFEADKTVLEADLRLSTTPFRILRLALTTLLPHYLKRRKRKKKNKKTTPKKSS